MMWSHVRCKRCNRGVIREHPLGTDPPIFCSEPCKRRHGKLVNRARREGLSEEEIESRILSNRMRLCERRETCPRPDKWGYTSRNLAYKYLQLMADDPHNDVDVGRLNVYYCKCGLWHIGNRPG